MSNQKQKHKVKFKNSSANKKINYPWIIGIAVATFFMAILLGYISLVFMEKVNLVLAIFILLILVMLGVFFDALGIAVTAANETPFHSMSAGKVPAAKESIMLIRNASIVANFFNDVIGDISGIISGAATAAIVVKIVARDTLASTLLGILLSAIVAAITVGGKAMGKEIALRKSNQIVYTIGKLVYIVTNKKIHRKNKKQS